MIALPQNSGRRHRHVFIIFLLAFGLSSGVFASERGVLTLDVRAADATRPEVLLLAGSWPDSCVPRLLRVAREGAELDVQLQASTQACKPEATAFEVPIETRTAFGSTSPERQIYRSRITLSRGGGPAELLGFRLLDLGAASVQPESGFWWSRSAADGGSLAGGGISLEVQGRQLAVSLLAFAADGSPTWYFGSADLDGRTAQVPLIRLLNGGGTAAANGRQAGVEAGPMLALEFGSPTQARAWLLGPATAEPDASLLLRPLLLRRAIFDGGATGSSWLGSWVLVSGTQARVLELTTLATDDGDSFRLLTTVLGSEVATLSCRYRGNGSGAEVDGCSLVDAGKVSASFNHIGIDRLSGTTPDGRPAQLVRLPR